MKIVSLKFLFLKCESPGEIQPEIPFSGTHVQRAKKPRRSPELSSRCGGRKDGFDYSFSFTWKRSIVGIDRFDRSRLRMKKRPWTGIRPVHTAFAVKKWYFSTESHRRGCAERDVSFVTVFACTGDTKNELSIPNETPKRHNRISADPVSNADRRPPERTFEQTPKSFCRGRFRT